MAIASSLGSNIEDVDSGAPHESGLPFVRFLDRHDECSVEPTRISICGDRIATLDELEAELEGSSALFLTPRHTFDSAIIGIVQRADGTRVVAYGSERIVNALKNQAGWDDDVAREWYEFNIAGAFVGPGSPEIIEPCDDE